MASNTFDINLIFFKIIFVLFIYIDFRFMFVMIPRLCQNLCLCTIRYSSTLDESQLGFGGISIFKMLTYRYFGFKLPSNQSAQYAAITITEYWYSGKYYLPTGGKSFPRKNHSIRKVMVKSERKVTAFKILLIRIADHKQLNQYITKYHPVWFSFWLIF